jgi:hypothetical protein
MSATHSASVILGPLLLVLSSCVGAGNELPTATSDRGDRLELVSIVPPSGAKVRAGQAASFTATVNYTLVAERGIVSLLVGNEGGNSLYPPGTLEPSREIGQGSGTLTLAASVTVPPAGVRQVQVHVVMSQQRYADLFVTVKYLVD